MSESNSAAVVMLASATLSASARVKSALSISHFNAAKLFAESASKIEVEESGLPYPQPGLLNLRSNAIAATVLSVATVEAKINEMFLHVVDKTLPPMRKVRFERLEVIKEIWADIEQVKTLRKYQIFLSAFESECFDPSKEPYQSMSLLIRLRNMLVHYKSQWDDEASEHTKLQTQLNAKFNVNALQMSALGSQAWFPHLCLGAGSANWSVSTARGFLKIFYDNLLIVDNPFV